MTLPQETQMMPQKRTKMVNLTSQNMRYYMHKIDSFVQDQIVKLNNVSNVKRLHIIWEWIVKSLNQEHL